RLRPQLPLRPHREDALDDAVLGEVGDHLASLVAEPVPASQGRFGTLSRVPVVRPFSALRYNEGEAGPLAELVAPPYDVIDAEARRRYLARSPYNVVHLTLPDSEEQAASDLFDWRERSVLTPDEEAFWWLAQDYTGPDGVARTREGFAASIE